MLNFLKKYISFVIIGLLLMSSAYFIFQKLSSKDLPKDLLSGSGRMDGDLILLNTKYSARVENIFVQDGDKVSLNQVVAKLGSYEFLSKEVQAWQMVESLKKDKLSYEQTLEAQKIQLKLLELNLPKAVKIKEKNLSTLKNSLEAVNLKIDEVKLNYDKFKIDYNRNKKLHNSKSISNDQFELIELKYKTTAKELESLEVNKKNRLNSIEIAKVSLEIEENNLKNIDVAKENLLASQTKLGSIENKIAQAKAAAAEIDAMIKELTLKSPVDGFVIEKIANIGEVIGAGMGVVTLSNTNSYYLKIFIDTMQNGKIKIGDRAVIFVDAYPNKGIEAKVTAISAKAEFTPKDVSVRSDRIQRVYAVHLKPLQYNAILKLGIPAIGVIAIDGADLPASLKEIPEI